MSENRMGLNVGGGDKLYICDGCLDTVCCTPSQLSSQWKWKKRTGGTGDAAWSLLLCDECEPA